MGCFLTCFDFKKKAKKSRRPRKKSLSQGEQNNGSYVLLDSDVPIKLDTIEEKEKPKEPPEPKVKKRVRFNLNVKTYEAIPHEDESVNYLSVGEEETKWKFNSKSVSTSYRYKDYTYDDDDGNDDYENNCYDKFGFDEDSEEDSDDGLSDVSIDGIQSSQENLPDDPEGLKLELYGRDRSRYGFSVLSPVENLTQWKRLKAKAKAETGKVKFQMEGLNLKQEEGGSFLGTRPNSNFLNFKKVGISVI